MEDLLSDIHIELKLATIGTRLGAALIDFIILCIIGTVFGILWGDHYATQTDVGFHLTGLPALAFFAVCFGVIPVQEGLTGKTIGKRLLKIRVVGKDGSDHSMVKSVARHLFDLVDCFFLAGIIVAATNPYRQRIGDLVAGTTVVQG